MLIGKCILLHGTGHEDQIVQRNVGMERKFGFHANNKHQRTKKRRRRRRDGKRECLHHCQVGMISEHISN